MMATVDGFNSPDVNSPVGCTEILSLTRDEWCPSLLQPKSLCWTSSLSDRRLSWVISWYRYGNRYFLWWILAVAKQYHGIYFESGARQMSSNLVITIRISSSSSERIQILGMRCQHGIASQGSSGDLRWAQRRGWVMETWSQEIQQDHTKSPVGLWTSIPCSRCLLLAWQYELHHWQTRSQDPVPAAWTWRSCDINSAGQWSVICSSDIMEQISQPCLERSLVGKSAQWMYTYRSYHNGSTHCLTFS